MAVLLLPCLCVVTVLVAPAAAAAADSLGSAQPFLDLQNRARADVGVAPLTWDDTVAAYARRYAATRKGDCNLQHSGGPYGESIFWGSAGANWTAANAVASWASEKQFYNCSDGSCAGDQGWHSEKQFYKCGHYTQMVWAKTTKVGCAAVNCDADRGTFIICEYDPPGNVLGVQAYGGCGRFNQTAQSSPQDFLNLHNAARAGVGAGMLSWDSTVAAYAADYAEKRKSDCRNVHSNGPYGENLFQGVAHISWTASDALFSWLGEAKNYNCNGNTCKDGQECGEYTQLMWTNSTRVGCASVTCDDSAGGGTFIACNYDPPGNVAGQRPYSCSQAGISLPGLVPDKGNGTNQQANGNSSTGNSSSSQSSKGSKSNPAILLIVLPVSIGLGIISAISICLWRNRSSLKRRQSSCSEEVEDIKSVLLDPSVIRSATGNFAEENKLGEGGFGKVYKGLMPDGQEIAVKRLAKGSKQGLRELKNELLLVAKLQHRNLVKLLGACLNEEDKLLVYEYIPNKSLDTFIFDDKKREQLAWDARYKIICGIARGLVYLHDESRVKVIHRDLKPSNILLDMDLNPKISDFGLASVFEGDHTDHITRRVAGTYGYMAPEYAVLGHVSTKSDIFSFGVIILEILTGRRNTISSETIWTEHLLSYVWENWTRGTITEIVDPSLRCRSAESEILKCIHIGLLCVQENPGDRPRMSNVILMIVGKSTTLPAPSRPAFLFRLNDENHIHHGINNLNPSLNKVTITELEPR
ncbi:cysteine-rich receptor-like protein kinase 6 [Oryza glaberrima]|uniref:cysteine-rich receptor-like protein kinase 6 n=1 Tax=Oryza glaberrima TaxID=4538 RepID=UPI00224C5A7B|nr:cysteine-rich receptor-like protein kinase 6 [Oryza glaberrima]